MKHTATLAFALAAAVAANAADLVTRDGTVYSGVEVRRVEPDGITIKHSAGLVEINARDLSDDDRAKYNLTPEAARAYAAKRRQDVHSATLARKSKEAAEKLQAALEASAREYYLHCKWIENGVAHCSDGRANYYIIPNDNYMPNTDFRVYAAPLNRVMLSPSYSAVRLKPMPRPAPEKPKAKPTSVINRPYF